MFDLRPIKRRLDVLFPRRLFVISIVLDDVLVLDDIRRELDHNPVRWPVASSIVIVAITITIASTV